MTEALERHRAKGTPLKKVHYYPPQASSPTTDTNDEAEESSVSESESEEETRHRRPYPKTPPNRFFSYPPTPSEASPTHEVPGNIIDEDEDAGLPGTKDLRQFSMKQAEKVVQKHTRTRSGSHSLRERRPTVEHRSQDIFEKDAERHQVDSSIHGKGILSTLLNLYQYPNSTRSIFSSRSSLDSESEQNGSEVESSDLLSQGYSFSLRSDFTSVLTLYRSQSLYQAKDQDAGNVWAHCSTVDCQERSWRFWPLDCQYGKSGWRCSPTGKPTSAKR